MCLSIRRRRKNRNYQLNKVVVVVVYGGLIGGKSVERERAERERKLLIASLFPRSFWVPLCWPAAAAAAKLYANPTREQRVACALHVSLSLSLFILPLLQADYTRLDRAGSQIDRE